MPQFARPNADITTGNWVPYTGVPGTLYVHIDEAVRDDADYIRSAINPTTVYETLLSSVLNPVSNEDHWVRYAYSKDDTGGSVLNLTVQLLQGTTVIASWVHNDIPATWTQANQLLTSVQAASITNYADLRLQFSLTYSGTPGRRGQISWAELEAPDVTFTGSIDGDGDLSATIVSYVPVAASMAAAGAMYGDLITFDSITGSIDGAGTLDANLNRVPLNLNGVIVGSGDMSANADRIRHMKGSVDGDSYLSADPTFFVALDGSVTGDGELLAKLFAETAFAGSIDGDGGLLAKLIGAIRVAGSIDGDSYLSAQLSPFKDIIGNVDGQGQLVGDMTTFDSLKGSINAQGAVAGDMDLAPLAMSGQLDGQGGLSAPKVDATIAVSGSIAGQSSFAAGELSAVVPLGAGQIDGLGDLDARLVAVINMAPGLMVGQGSFVGDLITFDIIIGTISAVGAMQGQLGRIMPFSGVIAGQSTFDGTLIEYEPIASGRIDGVGSIDGSMVMRPLGMAAVIHPQPKAFHGQSSLVGESILPELEIGDVILPDAGASSFGGYLVSVEGANFRLPPEPPDSGYVGGTYPRTVKVEIGGVESPDVRVLSETLLTFVAPPYSGNADVDPIPPLDLRIVNLDPYTGAELGEGNEAVLPDVFQYVRPAIGSSRSSHLLRTTRELLRVFKRQVLANTSLTTHTDYDDDVADMLDTVAVSELPAIVLVGPTLTENRFYAINQKDSLQNGREYTRPHTPKTVDLTFDVVGVSDKTYILLNLMHAVEAFFEANKWLYVDRDPDNLSLGKVRYEMDPVDEASVESRGNEDNIRHFRGSFVLRGFDVELETVETSYELDDASTDGQVALQVESI